MKTKEKLRLFSKMLINWGEDNLREFSWRKKKSPYEILIAEILLQRTKAEQVAKIYDKFIEKYPDLASLSHSSVSEIEKEIQSLGLVKRAISLKKMANQLLLEFSGIIPSTMENLRQLHGVGPYVTNAVLCHGYGYDLPTVDANFARILVRVFSLTVKKPAQKDKRVWNLAEEIVKYTPNKTNILNLAIMDVASEICKSKNPQCKICPLSAICDYNMAK